MIFPNKIEKGDFIGTTAVSMGCVDNRDVLRLENAEKKLQELGFNTIETENVRCTIKLESSSKEERAKQFMNLIEDDRVKAIIATSVGGEILLEILPYLDFDKIAKNPKWIQGFSDPSLLNFVITTKTNVATINSGNFKTFGMEPWHKSVETNVEFLTTSKDFIQSKFDLFEGERNEDENPYSGFLLNEKVEHKALYRGKETIKGRVIGGGIDTLVKIVGTPFDNVKNFCSQFDEGMLWYIDNCELNIAEFYRVMWQLKQVGWFDNANGFLIGRTPVKKEMFDFNYLDSLHKCFDDMNIPVFYDVDIGHVPPQWVMVNGSLGEFSFNNGESKLSQKLI